MAISWPGQRNGQIVSSLMTVVLGYRMHPAAAVSFIAMRAACFLATGVWLGISDAYRPYAEQERVFRARYTPGHTSGIRWAGTYWRKRPGQAAAAVPGYSNHGWGLALDINNYGSTSGRVFRWLLDHAGAFGWSWATGRNVGEPWHWEYVGSLARPAGGSITPIIEEKEDNMLRWYLRTDGNVSFADQYTVIDFGDSNRVNIVAAKLCPDQPAPIKLSAHEDAIMREECNKRLATLRAGIGGGGVDLDALAQKIGPLVSAMPLDYAELARAVNDDAARRLAE